MEQEKNKKRLSVESTVLLTIGFTALAIVIVGIIIGVQNIF